MPKANFTRIKFVQLVQRRLGMRSDLASDILEESMLAQQELSRVEPYPWFLLRSTVDSISAAPYFMSAEFIDWAFKGESIFYTDNAAYKLILKERQEFKEDIAPSFTTTGRPRYATLADPDGQYPTLLLAPVPDATYPVRFYLYYEAEPLNTPTSTDDSYTVWTNRAPELLAVATARRIAVSTRDPELVAWLDGEERRLRAKLDAETISHQEAGIERLIREWGGEEPSEVFDELTS